MIEVPHTYYEWMRVLDIFKEKTDDQGILAAVKNGTIQWQSGVAERFSKRYIDAVQYRLDMAVKKFQKDISYAHGAEYVIIQALLNMRREMQYLIQVVNVQVFPEDIRKQYVQMMIDYTDEIQKILESSAEKERSGRLVNIVRKHRINSFEEKIYE